MTVAAALKDSVGFCTFFTCCFPITASCLFLLCFYPFPPLLSFPPTLPPYLIPFVKSTDFSAVAFTCSDLTFTADFHFLVSQANHFTSFKTIDFCQYSKLLLKHISSTTVHRCFVYPLSLELHQHPCTLICRH